MSWRVARIDYQSPSVIGVLPERGPARVSPTSFGFTSLRKVNCPVRLKSAPPSSLPSTSTSSLRAARTSAARDNLLSAKKRSEEHTSELQSPCNLVCRLLLEKKNMIHHSC